MANKSVETGRASTVIVERPGGSGVAAGLVVLAVVVVALIAAYFLFSANRDDRLRTDAVSSAASSVANSASDAAGSVSEAAKSATGAMAPNK
jgi:uncharacterized protein (UPF0333 family)